MCLRNQTIIFFCEFPKNVCFPQILSEIHFLELFVAFILFVSLYSLRQRQRYGLPVWPFFGMFPSLLIGVVSTEFYEWLTNILQRQNHSTITYKGIDSFDCVFTADPNNVEYILRTKFSNFPKGEFLRTSVHDLLGDGIFNTDDELWRQQRKMLNIAFHSTEFRDMTTESLIELVHSHLLLVLEEQSSPIDLQDILSRLTFDNACIIVFGVDPACLRLGLPEIPLARAFEDATELTALRFAIPSFILNAMKFLNMGMEKKIKRSISQIDKFAEEVIHSRKKELEAFEISNDNKSSSDLLTMFMRLKNEEGKMFSDKFLRDICVSLIFAGRDTTSVALSWFFWLLDQNPTVEQQILNEINGIIAERAPLDMGSKNPVKFTPEEIKKMCYLQATLSEVLRLYPSLPLDHKEVLEDDVFPDGTILKKGTKVVYAIYAMGRMERIWGKDCRKFKPERWLRDGQYTGESAYKFTAFNGGPRICLGKDFAYYQMKVVAASVIYKYRVKVVENHVVKPKFAITMYMKYGLKVILSKRNDTDL